MRIKRESERERCPRPLIGFFFVAAAMLFRVKVGIARVFWGQRKMSFGTRGTGNERQATFCGEERPLNDFVTLFATTSGTDGRQTTLDGPAALHNYCREHTHSLNLR